MNIRKEDKKVILDYFYAANRCDLVLMSSSFDTNTLSALPIKSNVAYIRSGSQLFYVHKTKKECTEIWMSEEKIGKFDQALSPSYLAKSLSSDELDTVMRITGHACVVLIKKEAEHFLNLYYQLNVKINDGSAVFEDLQEIVTKIYDYSLLVSDENIFYFNNAIKKMSKIYHNIFLSVVKIFNQSKSQLSKLNKKEHEMFVGFFNQWIVFPMIEENLFYNQHGYMSRYFGKIQILFLENQSMKQVVEFLKNLDKEIDEEIFYKKNRGREWPVFLVYLFSFRYLNAEEPHFYTAKSNRCYFDYLKKYFPVESGNEFKISLIFVPDKIIQMFFLKNDFDDSLSVNLIEENFILFNGDRNMASAVFLKKFISAIQEFFDTKLLSKDVSCLLTKNEIDHFYQLVGKIKFKNKQHQLIIENMLPNFNNQSFSKKENVENQTTRNLMEFLIDVSPNVIQEIIFFIFNEIKKTKNKSDYKSDALKVYIVIENIKSKIDMTISRLAHSYFNFIKHKVKEELDNNIHNNSFFIMRVMWGTYFDYSEEIYRWHQCLDKIIRAEKMMANRIQHLNLLRGLIEGNSDNAIDLMRVLIRITSMIINQVDDAGLVPLAYAVMYRRDNMADLLQKNGASFDFHFGQSTLFHIAAKNFNNRMVSCFLDNGFDSVVLDSDNKTPLVLLCDVIADSNFYYEITEEMYQENINCLTRLLAGSNESIIFRQIRSDNFFYHSLLEFRKKMAFIYILNLSGVFPVPEFLARELMLYSAATFIGPNPVYIKCYQDIMTALLENSELFGCFLENGIHEIYQQMEFSKKEERQFKAIAKKYPQFALRKIKDKNFDASDLSIKEKIHDLTCINSVAMTHMLAAESLAAVVLAKRKLKNDHFIENKLTMGDVDKWKIKVANKKDEHLMIAILGVFSELKRIGIDCGTYSNMVLVLSDFIIQQRRVLHHPLTFFVKEVKERYCDMIPKEEIAKKRSHNHFK